MLALQNEVASLRRLLLDDDAAGDLAVGPNTSLRGDIDDLRRQIAAVVALGEGHAGGPFGRDGYLGGGGATVGVLDECVKQLDRRVELAQASCTRLVSDVTSLTSELPRFKDEIRRENRQVRRLYQAALDLRLVV